MVDRYLRDVLDGENRVSQGRRERQYLVVLARPRTRCKASGLAPIGSDLRLRRSRTETTVRSRSHPGHRSPVAAARLARDIDQPSGAAVVANPPDSVAACPRCTWWWGRS